MASSTGNVFLRNGLKCFRKTVTFDAGTGSGAVGTVAIATTTGAVLIVAGAARCTTLLTGSGTVELGTASNTDGLIPQTTGTAIDANEFWQDATPEFGVSPAITNQCVGRDIILTVASNTITAGVIEFTFYYLPLSVDGNLA